MNLADASEVKLYDFCLLNFYYWLKAFIFQMSIKNYLSVGITVNSSCSCGVTHN